MQPQIYEMTNNLLAGEALQILNKNPGHPETRLR